MSDQTPDLAALAALAEAATPGEEWREIPGYEGYYEASTLGRVRSLPRTVPHAAKGPTRLPGQMLTPRRSTKRGYPTVRLTRFGVGRHFGIHRLVALAFIPNPEMLPCVLHWDDDPTNNKVGNLRWGTLRENNLDRERNGIGNAARLSPSCPNGHPYTSDNTYHTRSGWRRCRRCTNEGQRRRYQARRAER